MTHLLLFTKYPTPNFAKTRLIPSEGPDGAASISRLLTEKTVSELRKFRDVLPESQLIIHYTAATDITRGDFEQWLQISSGERLVEQTQGHLGMKLEHAFQTSFDEHAAKHVIVVGSDCPQLSSEILQQATEALRENDVVIGPAVDGGYYLLGTNRLIPALFRDIPWSTSVVFEKTMAVAEREHVSVFKLPELRDVDEAEDVEYFRKLGELPPPTRFGRLKEVRSGLDADNTC